MPATAALESREAGPANLNLPADPETETSTGGSAGVTATSTLPRAASPDSSTVLYPAHPQNENTSRMPAKIDLKASPSNSPAVPSTVRTPEPESQAPIQSKPESRELSTPNQSAHAQKAKQPAEVAKKTSAPSTAKATAVLLSAPPQVSLPPVLSSSVQPSASVAAEPSPAAPHQSRIMSAAIGKNSFGLTNNSQSLSAQQNATTLSSAQKSRPIAENQAELPADSASTSASQRPGPGSLESAASLKETAPQNALAAHNGATQSRASAAGFIANAASPAIPA
ncbi:MAG TPA: hypothetical protein VG345_14835, partial [Bryobacteraceae bacterium]|nr:hypothetical protein [Bryobacteraceae bacterium]